MSAAYQSADLLLKLYELRREETMRKARNWFITFNPDSADDLGAVLRSEHSAYFRMVTSFWDMAASFVLNGAIDEKMFNDANGEHFVVYAKIEPFVAEHRQRLNSPHWMANVEQVVMKTPNAQDRLAALRERFRAMSAPRR